ncbi:YncE family protein [Dyadobacter pollutisoli]|jgi:hypothetical protein|uniref:DUF5074 domain-containing protein n=1 Tax=Dyadobacter pollutisoli TaxID=2910158 RepID=A0A9E8NA56_9BACT|nr:DUF5074 domain-containing protein [Dyadobacter pollutisoli]WAC11317.1 hypothetical protein ON006_26745 [Dyadobacter pollutisoli]
MKKQLTRLVAVTSLSILAWSCNQSDPAPKGDYIQGVFVINEGNFSQNNGAISFFVREQTVSEADIFSKVNGTALKGGVQGYAAVGEKGLILVDNSAAGLDKVEIINSNTFKSEATIGAPDIENPREVVIGSNNTAYVSCWGTNASYTFKTGYIAVIDLNTNKVTRKIDIAAGPENMVFNAGKLFVGTTSFGTDKNLYVINTGTNIIEKSVPLDIAPNPIGIDANGKLWVNTGIKALKLNADTYVTEATLTIGTNATKIASNFAFSSDRKTVFFVLSYFDANYLSHGETYKFGVNDAQINVTTPFIKRNFTGLTVDPSQGLIYAGVTPSFAQAGYAVRYRADGSLVDSVKVGVAPTGFFFK